MEILTYQGEGIAATNKDDKYVQHEAFINKMPVMQYDDFLHQLVYPINKCLIVGDPTPLHELELRLSKELEGGWMSIVRPTFSLSVYRSASTKPALSIVSSLRLVLAARRLSPAGDRI